MIHSVMLDVVKSAWEAGKSIDVSDIGYGRQHWGDCKTIKSTPESYYPFLAGLVRANDCRNIIEIGTHWGGSTLAMYRGIVDRPNIVTMDTVQDGRQVMGLSGVRRIKGDACNHEVLACVMEHFGKYGPMDLLYIDAAHDYDSTLAQFFVYTRLFAPTIVVLDDITLQDDMRNVWSIIQASHPLSVDASAIIPEIRQGPGFGVVLP